MPRTPDHAARRAQIADALVRVASRDGLHAVTMRSVAAEAEVSLRLVQYYFHDKEHLLIGALEHLEQRSHRRWAQRLAALPDPPPPRAVIEAFLLEALPTDDASRVFHLVGTSYAVLAMTDPRIAGQPFIGGVGRLERQLADTLATARAGGELADDVDVDIEATRLVTLTNGLGTTVLVGQRSVDDAIAVVRYHLDRLFRPARGGSAR
ncbi:TetR family transcriptional regulator [Nocardia otitidiscaviarum]|uniref:TetR family transcriptional regulator n=1 Tax=Nocardia otitidiscaviarum TaxID=1823 RepID=A0A516NM79_9NOCA|nr:TetR family transcriptional regulator C-terminal domain-containing protein [Nocardia otitidiscaviarum]MCP9624857.1 TetR family transcriptional regulator C-terminal domain-containing protein [Nocardia otitidiscaviarum]QDP79999.1 TetR family transcriptional regulator [Nocardia otitidiscaviarum]